MWTGVHDSISFFCNYHRQYRQWFSTKLAGGLDDSHDLELEGNTNGDDDPLDIGSDAWMDNAGIRPRQDELLNFQQDEDQIEAAVRHLGHREEDTTYDWNSDLATYGGYDAVAHGPE